MNVPAAAINLGSCWSCLDDLVMPSTMASGARCVAEAIVRRWSTSQGQLIDDPNYGFNLIDLVSSSLTPAQLRRAGQQAGAEAQKDERVLSCAATVTLTVAGLINVVGNVTTANGPFKLVVAVTQVTTTLLLVST